MPSETKLQPSTSKLAKGNSTGAFSLCYTTAAWQQLNIAIDLYKQTKVKGISKTQQCNKNVKIPALTADGFQF